MSFARMLMKKVLHGVQVTKMTCTGATKFPDRLLKQYTVYIISSLLTICRYTLTSS